jgi:putative peptidoglycan lipid II flippase
MSFASSVANKISRRFGGTRGRSVNHLIFQALVSLASGVLLVRAMGVVNQIAVTSRFGAGAVMDAYFVSSGLPLLVASFLIGAIEASVIPTFARLREQRSPEHTVAVFSTLVNLFLIGATILTLVMLVFRRQLLFLTAPALNPSRMELAVQLAPFIFPVLLLMIMAGLLECVLNTQGQFGWPAYAAALVPLTSALLVLVAGARFGVVALAVGTLVGVGLQLGVLIYRLRLAHISYRPVLDWRLPEVGLVFVAAAPALLGAMVNQASPLVDQIFASYLSAGSISALNYAIKVAGLPVGIVFVTVGRAALPYLSRQAADRDMRSFKATLRLYLWIVGLGTAALSIILLVLAHPLVRILFQRGAFTAEDTNLTAVTMMGFAVGLAPMGMGFLLARAFSALGKNHILMYVTIFSVFANAAFDYALGRYWQSFGIALATSAVYCCTLIILLVLLRRAIGKLDLLTPPAELVRLIQGVSTGQYYQTLRAWKDENLPPLRVPERLRLPLMCGGAAALALVIGAIIPRIDSQLALRIAVGLPLILLLLRYRYALLIAWLLVGALVGSSLPFFQGQNIDTGLTIPTLLLLATVSIPETLRRVPALSVLFLYLMWLLVGIGSSPLGASEFLKTWLLYVDYVAVAALATTLVSTRRRLLLVVDVMLGIGAFIALYGIVDYIRHGALISGTGAYRSLSVFAAAPPFALFLSLVIPLAIYRTFIAHTLLVRLGALSVLLVLLVALGLTFSRGALITLPLSFVISASFLPSRRIRNGLLGGAAGLVALAVIMVTVANVPLFARFSSSDISSLNGRTYLWAALLQRFDPLQIQGNGLGSATALLTRLNIGVGGVTGNGLLATAPSNLYIGTLYDTGIIGVGLLLTAMVMLGFSLIIGIRRTTGERRLLFAMALLALINMLIQSIEVDDLWSQGIALYFWVAVTLPYAAYWFKSSPDNEPLLMRARQSPELEEQSGPAQPAARGRLSSEDRERRYSGDQWGTTLGL